MLKVCLYFIIIIVVMKQACLKCIDCCFEIGDKVVFLFFFPFFFSFSNVCARAFLYDLSNTGLE